MSSLTLTAALMVSSMPLPPTLIVAPLRSSQGASKDAQTLTRLVRIYAGQSSQYTLVTPEDLGAIDEEIKRQLSGGCDEASCIAELGGALGAKYLVTGGLDQLGKRYILTLKLVDIEKVRALSTVADQSETVEAFADSLPAKVRELLKDGGRAPTALELQVLRQDATKAVQAAQRAAEQAKREADDARRQLEAAQRAADQRRIAEAQRRAAQASEQAKAVEAARRAAAKREAEALAQEQAEREAAKRAKKALGSFERPAKHCKAIKRARPKAKDGMYFLKRSKAPYPSYCDMTYDGGGWTLVLSIDGRKPTFAYDSPLWTNRQTLNAKLDKKTPYEAKTKGFYRIPFDAINLVTWDGGKLWRNLKIDHSARSLYHLFKGNKYQPTKVGREAWKRLVKGGSLQARCNREGFNVYNPLMRVRIGIVANQENDCVTPDSRIGFGAGSNDLGRGPGRSVGNEAIGFAPDNGVKRTTAWGLVFVR